MKTIICSTGTSAAKIICKPSDLTKWIDECGGEENAARIIFDKIRHINPDGEALQNELSAEIHSLVRIGIGENDRIILLSSETEDGVVCANTVKLYLGNWFKEVEVIVKKIPGLQVRDADRFKREGVVHFVKHCLETINNFGPEFVILNPTGGYKALVPYTVLIGMLKGVQCRYIFEQSATLLELPPLPITFDRNRFESYRSLFERIERETSISYNEYEKAITHEDRSVLDSLIEKEGNEITLSGVGHLLLDEVRQPTALVPFLSKKAFEECLNNLCKLKQCDPFRFLERISLDQNSFKKAEHINMDNGLRWLKPGNTTDRYLVSIEDWRLLIWRAIREDEVGPDYPHKVEIKKPQEERKHYTPFIRMEIFN